MSQYTPEHAVHIETVTDLRTRAGKTPKKIRLQLEKPDSIDFGISFS
jgi:hypothetical protein